MVNIDNHLQLESQLLIIYQIIRIWQKLCKMKTETPMIAKIDPFFLQIQNFVFGKFMLREPSQITFAFFGIWPRTYPPSLHFLCSKFCIFLTTYPPLNADVICEGSLRLNPRTTVVILSVHNNLQRISSLLIPLKNNNFCSTLHIPALIR